MDTVSVRHAGPRAPRPVPGFRIDGTAAVGAALAGVRATTAEIPTVRPFGNAGGIRA